MSHTRIITCALAVAGVLFIRNQAMAQAPQPTESARPKPVVIADDNGGLLQNYYERYRTYVAAGATFRIDGRCRSACTLVLLWADRVCVTERAALGFHQLRDKSGQRVQSASDRLMSLYPAEASAQGAYPIESFRLAAGGNACSPLST